MARPPVLFLQPRFENGLLNPLVLVVDDNPDFLEMLEMLLSNNGYRVITAENGFQALALLESNHPDVVVLDIMMPERTGIEVLEQIRWNEEWVDLPVICLSAISFNGESVDFIEEFSVGLVDKADLDDLLKKLKEALPQAG